MKALACMAHKLHLIFGEKYSKATSGYFSSDTDPFFGIGDNYYHFGSEQLVDRINSNGDWRGHDS